MIQVQSTNDLASNGVKTLLYGGAGVGKTPLCGTAPNPIILSAESGLLSLRGKSIPYIEIKTHADLIEAYNWCANSREAKQYYTICLDSLNEIIEVILEDEKKKTKDPRKAYGEIIGKGVQMAKAFRDLPNRCVVCVCKEEYVKDETTGGMMFSPAMPGNKLGPSLPYFFDLVTRLELFPGQNGQPPQRALRCWRSWQHVARDRSGMLAEYEQPNLTVVFRKILGL